jgi:F0F1-type ATP synthase assembly protein I
MSQNQNPERNQKRYTFNLALAAATTQVGCLTLVVIVGALVAGLWLDAKFSTKPIITIVLMVSSIPVTLVAMFWVVRKATSKIKSNTKTEVNSIEEVTNSGEI